MRFVPVNCIREGMVVAKQLLGNNGELLLNSGTPIKQIYINKIKELGYSGVYINDCYSDDIELNELINDGLKVKTIKTLKNTFAMVGTQKDKSPKILDQFEQLVNEILEGVLSSRETIINMIDLKVFDDYTFYHSMNVALLSIVTGISLGLNKSSLEKLAMAAILHDIGKVFIPKDILNKPGPLTDDEMEIIKKHSTGGYQYLKDKTNLSTPSYIGVLQHHERYDGNGYPNQLKGDNISIYGKIICVTDVYDALTSKRPYRLPLTPSEAIEYIMGGGGTFFDPIVATCFASRIAPYPVGTCVILSNNKVGIVMENYADCILRPKLKIIYHGEALVDPYIIDLRNDSTQRGVTIIKFSELG